MKRLLYFLSISFIVSCGNPDSNSDQQQIAVDSDSFLTTTKYAPGDPFIETMKGSEYFKMSGLEDKIFETTNGTVISIPKAAFKDAQGNIVEKEITIEITDISSFEEQFNANINSPAGQNIMLNGGALYINATSNGGQLYINDDSPIYVELNQAFDPDVLIFEGIRNDKGEMQWINPEKQTKYLVPVELSSLDFLPEGFAEEVKKNMPFENYKEATSELIDSLYYSLLPQAEEFVETLSDSVNFYSSNFEFPVDELLQDSTYDNFPRCKAINPASIKVIRNQKFANSFIATKQFETRMQTIYQSRNQEALEIYTSNLSKDLSECDHLVSTLFEDGSGLESTFSNYATEDWTNIKDLPRSVRALGKYYSKQLKKIEKELNTSRRKYEEALRSKANEADKMVVEYRELLLKRQAYRLTRHGFKLEKTGWVAPAHVIIVKGKLALSVDEGADYDRVHVYTFDPTIQSLFAWQSSDKIHFNHMYPEDDIWVSWTGVYHKALVIAYKDGVPFIDLQDFKVTRDIEVNFDLRQSSKAEVNRLLKKQDRQSKRFNKVGVDLEYQTFFYNEKQRQQQLNQTRHVIQHLYSFIYQCDNTKQGLELFNAHCGSCHHTEKQATGPPITHISNYKNKDWFIDFVQDAPKYYRSNLDEYTACMLEHYVPISGFQPPANLSNAQLEKIWTYLLKIKTNTPIDKETEEIRKSCIK